LYRNIRNNPLVDFIYDFKNTAMKFESKDLIYIALLIVAGYFIFQMNLELSGANAALKIVNTELEDQKTTNLEAYQKLENKINSQVNLTQKLQIEISDLEQSKKIINKKSDEKKAAINNTNDADSLTNFFTRRYGKASN